MGLSGTNNLMQPHSTSYQEAHHNYTDLAALEQLKVKAREEQESALRPVAEQFEALFVQQVLKEARKVSFDENWLDGNQGAFYKDWYDKQLSLDLAAKGTLGFADKIVEQLLPHISPAQVELKQLDQGGYNDKREKPEVVALTEQVLALRAM